MIDCVKFKPNGQWHRQMDYGVPLTECERSTSDPLEESAVLLWPKAWGLPPGRKCSCCFPKEAPDA